MHCPSSDRYIKQSLSKNELDRLQDDILSGISSSSSVPATYGIPTKDLFSVRYEIWNKNDKALFLRDGRGGGRYVGTNDRVIIVRHREWLATMPSEHWSKRGGYHQESGAIFLHEGEAGNEKTAWCLKTLIHETLHSVSIYSRAFRKFPNIFKLHLSLNEGITEFLTGYILFKNYPDCYRGWKSGQFDRCSISYRENVKLWCSLSQVIGIGDLAQYYLSLEENPADAWNNFTGALGKKNLRLVYQLDPTKAYNEPQFTEACIVAFPAFKGIYESSSKCLDFSRIP